MVNWRKQNGGAYLLGIDVHNIAEFLPSSISDIVCWIRADPALVRSQTLGEYISQQPPQIKQALMAQNMANLLTSVITEIRSDTPLLPNSFVRDETAGPTAFPVLQDFPGKIATIDISNYIDPATKQPRVLQLITKAPIELPDVFSSYSIWRGVKTEYLKSQNMLRIYSDLVETPQITQENGVTMMTPTAELRELIVYARELTPEEAAMLEGYIAYKRNDQYELPFGHPYLPDLSYTEPMFTQINADLKPIEDAITTGLKDVVALYEKYKMYKGHDNIAEKYGMERQLAQTALGEIRQLRMELSKGALVARKEGSMNINAAYRAIAQHNWDKNRAFSNETIAGYIGTFRAANGVLQDYISVLRNFNPVNAVPVGMSGGGLALAPASRNPDATAFYLSLRTLDTTIKMDGNNIYSAMQTKAYQEAQNALEILEGHIQAEISAFHILQATPWKPITSPQHAAVDAYNMKITEYLTTGDYAYLIKTLETYKALAESVVKDYLNSKSHVIFSSLYAEYIDYINHTCAEFIRETTYIRGLIQACFDQNAIIHNADIETPVLNPIYMNTMLYLAGIKKRYIRHVTTSDAFFIDFEYIETDASGLPIRDEVLGLVPIFPGKMGMVQNGSSFFLHGKEEFVIMAECSESVMHYLHDGARPAQWRSTADAGELDRMKVNSIYSIVDDKGSAGAADAGLVVLPSNAIPLQSFYLVYNATNVPICVLNPGSVVQRVCIGPREALLFLYINQENMYGFMPWSANYLPYDTLSNAPRSNYSCFVPELRTEIYVRETGRPGPFFEPVYDADWNFVRVQRAPDGLVYDIDDVNHAIPYSVNTGVQQSLNALALHPKTTHNIHVQPTIYVTRDRTTGVGVLCLAGGPVTNEFGYCKTAQTPLQFIQGSVKIEGAYGDLVLSLAQGVERQAPLEPYINYYPLFTTPVIRNVTPTIQIYTTALFNPILSADGKLLAINPTAVVHPTDLIDVGGLTAIEPYNPIDIPPMLQQEAAATAAALSQQHYEDGIAYIQKVLADLEGWPNEIAKFGDSTQSLVYSTNALSAKIRAEFSAITAYTLDTNITDYASSYAHLKIEYRPYREIIDAIKEYTYQLELLTTDGQAAIQENIDLIHSTEQQISAKTGMTNIVALQPIKAAVAEQQKQFLIATNAIQNQLSANSINDIQSKFDTADTCVANAKRIVNVDLLHAITNSGGQYSQTITQAISAIYSDLTSKQLFCKKIALWLGVYSDPDQSAYEAAAPAATQTADHDIYSRYSNPLFKRDWYNVPNIQADKLKEDVATCMPLLSNLPAFQSITDVEALTNMKAKYEELSTAVEHPMNALRNGAMYAYGEIQAASKKLQEDNGDLLIQKIGTANHLIGELDAKFPALETLAVAAGSSNGNLEAERAAYEHLKAVNAPLLSTDLVARFDRLDQMTLNAINETTDDYIAKLRQIVVALNHV
jgi:hypothetical protein